MTKIQPSVTIFLHHKDKYLFIEKFYNRKVDSGRINGIGGKVKRDEDFLSAVIRETREETGLIVVPKQINFCGFLNTMDGYPDDWFVGFFRIEVESFDLPCANKCSEGILKWLTPQELKQEKAVFVDDLYYLFPKYIENDRFFFAHAKLNNLEKVEKINIQII